MTKKNINKRLSTRPKAFSAQNTRNDWQRGFLKIAGVNTREWKPLLIPHYRILQAMKPGSAKHGWEKKKEEYMQARLEGGGGGCYTYVQGSAV